MRSEFARPLSDTEFKLARIVSTTFLVGIFEAHAVHENVFGVIERSRREKSRLTTWKRDPRKASANKACNRVGVRNGLPSPDRVVGP